MQNVRCVHNPLRHMNPTTAQEVRELGISLDNYTGIIADQLELLEQFGLRNRMLNEIERDCRCLYGV